MNLIKTSFETLLSKFRHLETKIVYTSLGHDNALAPIMFNLVLEKIVKSGQRNYANHNIAHKKKKNT